MAEEATHFKETEKQREKGTGLSTSPLRFHHLSIVLQHKELWRTFKIQTITVIIQHHHRWDTHFCIFSALTGTFNSL
jgi:hypothetical protein